MTTDATRGLVLSVQQVAEALGVSDLMTSCTR